MAFAPYTIDTPNPVKINILGEAQNWRCAYCGIRCDGGHNADDAPSRDHVIPKAAFRGRPIYEHLDWSNEIMACRLCNSHRGAMYARAYFQMVQWKGRLKAAAWARRKQRERVKSLKSK